MGSAGGNTRRDIDTRELARGKRHGREANDEIM